MARAGNFRARVRIERQGSAGTLDAYGNPSAAAWETLGHFWGDLREATGKERLAAGRLEAPADARLRLRDLPETRAITPADRVVDGRGRVWKITGGPVDPDGRRRQIEFTLEAGGAVS